MHREKCGQEFQETPGCHLAKKKKNEGRKKNRVQSGHPLPSLFFLHFGGFFFFFLQANLHLNKPEQQRGTSPVYCHR